MSLQDYVKKRVFDDMLRVLNTGNGWRILVVDEESMKILANCCRTFEILDESITHIELISKVRQPYPNADAVYFISPTEENIKKIITDFTVANPTSPARKEKKSGFLSSIYKIVDKIVDCVSPEPAEEDAPAPKTNYRAAHIFFTGAVNEGLVDTLKSSAASKFIRCCRELFVDVLAAESQLFLLNAVDKDSMTKVPSPENSWLHRLYSPDVPAAAIEADLAMIANKLVSLCITLGDFPLIRYHTLAGQQRTISARIAALVQNKLEAVLADDPNLLPPQAGQRSTLLILDRTVDTIAPLVHEFTYQAMASDLNIIVGNQFAPRDQDLKAGGLITLNDTDQLWKQARHIHIANASTFIVNSFNKFIEENKDLITMRGDGSDQGKKDNISSLAQMKSAIAALPQFGELKKKYEVHIEIVQACLAKFKENNLDNVAGLEQDMATHETGEGKTVTDSSVLERLVSLLDDNKLSKEDKLRLLILYVIYKEGIADNDRSRLLTQAKLSAAEGASITNLVYLGIKLLKDKKAASSNRISRSNIEHGDYELSRYVTNVKVILGDLVNGTLPTEKYPFVKNPVLEDEAESSARRSTAAASARTTKPKWQKANKKDKVEEAPVRTGGRTLVFMAGGATYSEIRAAYELASGKREIFFGSTNVIRPSIFVQEVAKLSKGLSF